ncbi:MAG TPA: Rieske 2Fe-2S domain-containing protein [Stellaceae bacterium]|nr:Rieske 2Fe-2S domain-containing protein [Stellaceae bacterium]
MALSKQDNELLTRTSAGTLMGDLLRRFWIPTLLPEELPGPDCPPVRVQLMGERLVAFRDSMDRIALIEEFCAHRGVSLWFGRNEECGLRCPYHGWKYDVTGQCVDLPSEEEATGMRQRIRLKAYPCVEHGGVIWAYMGPPELKPELPALEWTHVQPERRYISKRLQECNFLQAMEGGIDSSHVPFLHAADLNRDPMFKGAKGNEYTERDRKPFFEVKEFDGGLLIGARRTADNDRYYWRITPWIVPWYTLIPPRAGHPIGGHAWVPIDDEHCWAWSLNYLPHKALPADQRQAMEDGLGIHSRAIPGTFIPLANKSNDYLIDRNAQAAGQTFSGVAGFAMQDAAVQESMGPIADRSRENLVNADNGVIFARRMLLRLARANRDGKPIPPLNAEAQRVRSCSIELDKSVAFTEGARHGLYRALDTEPVTV